MGRASTFWGPLPSFTQLPTKNSVRKGGQPPAFCLPPSQPGVSIRLLDNLANLATVGNGKRKSQASLGRSVCHNPNELLSAFLLQLFEMVRSFPKTGCWAGQASQMVEFPGKVAFWIMTPYPWRNEHTPRTKCVCCSICLFSKCLFIYWNVHFPHSFKNAAL